MAEDRKDEDLLVERKLNEANKSTVGQRIALQRKKLGWNQFDLAWNSGISRTEIGRIERDLCDPKVETIESLEAALGMELYDHFMEQRRERAKAFRKKTINRESELIGQFEKELARRGIKGEELKVLLEDFLKPADSQSGGE